MTDKEVIKLAQGLITDFKCESYTMMDFCNTVIKKFEQQPCEDCISKTKLLAKIDEERKHLLDLKMDGAEHIVVHHARRIIEDMPSITPSYNSVKPELDCIGRDDAIELISGADETDGNEPVFSGRQVIKMLKGLPPVKPQPKAEWIPCSKRLPDTDDEVLCWYEYYHWSWEKVLPEYGIGCYLRETSAWCGEVANGKDVRVIAWMPLPSSYQAESEDVE